MLLSEGSEKASLLWRSLVSNSGVMCRQDEHAALKQYVHGSPSGGPVWFLEDGSRSRDQSSGRRASQSTGSSDLVLSVEQETTRRS